MTGLNDWPGTNMIASLLTKNNQGEEVTYVPEDFAGAVLFVPHGSLFPL